MKGVDAKEAQASKIVGTHVMMDIESLDTKPSSVILSIGMVAFNAKENIESMYVELEAMPQILDGRTVSRDTVDWWKKNDEEELIRLTTDGWKSLPYLSKCIREFILKHNPRHIWSRGYMDAAILDDIGATCWPYYKWRDVRTLDIFGIKMVSNSHYALSDCYTQINYVREVLK